MTKLHHVVVFNAKHEQEASIGANILANPGGMAVDAENRFLYVVDTGNDVVDVFDADSLKLLRKIGKPSHKHNQTDPGTFSLPTNVAVDQEGNVYVTDTFNDRVEIFDADGHSSARLAKTAMAREISNAQGHSGRLPTAIYGSWIRRRTG